MQYEDNTIKGQTPSFWDTLRLFWSKERIDAWYNAIFSNPTKTEICQNLICLCPNAHKYWGMAYFALKPIRISDDKKRLDVQFFWLSSTPNVPGVNILQVPLLSVLDHGPNSTKLTNYDTNKLICSGDVFSLKTDDPVLQPLPDFKLLEMQWFLHRVQAMSGAAEPLDDFHDDSDDDMATDRLDMYTEDDWDMEMEEGPATDRF
jgi:hypothetical protein